MNPTNYKINNKIEEFAKSAKVVPMDEADYRYEKYMEQLGDNF